MNNSIRMKKAWQVLRMAWVMTILTFGLQAQPAQPTQSITGTVIDAVSGEEIPYAHIALFDSAGIHLLAGCAGNQQGFFSLPHKYAGTFLLKISALGFEWHQKPLVFRENDTADLGTISLRPAVVSLDAVDVMADRMKAVSTTDRTSYLVNSLMEDVSNTGTDILRLIPGVGVDLLSNISLEGSQNILILVNGRERDRSFVNQIPASRIDKIEIMKNPPAKYESRVDGVIHIVLKNDQMEGIEGHVHAELPAAESEVFIYPTAGLSYGKGKFTVFASYNAEMRYFRIEEKSYRQILNGNQSFSEIDSEQQISQKNWVSRFNYGVDLLLNEKNILNYYGFSHAWSQEHDGTARLFLDKNPVPAWSAQKEDDDINRGIFNSLFYKHIFDPSTGKEISVDLSHHYFHAVNSVTYQEKEFQMPVISEQRPSRHAFNLRVDYTLPISDRFRFNQGFQAKRQSMEDDSYPEFMYQEQILALYSTADYTATGIECTVGWRVEFASSGVTEQDYNGKWSLTPNFATRFKLGPRVAFRAEYRKANIYPGLHQLNPGTWIHDPYTRMAGNPDLKPEIRSNVGLELSFSMGSQYFSIRLFSTKVKDAIHNLTYLTDTPVFETHYGNLGNIRQTGMQLSGAFSLGRIAGIHPSLKIAHVDARPGQDIREAIASSDLVIEAGISAFARITEKITASFTGMYASPANQIQARYFSDVLYFVSLEKTFGDRWKAGITSALPFAGKFNYRGYEINAPGFYSHSEGIIQLSAVPVIGKISYNLQSGHKRNRVDRPAVNMDIQNSKGF